MGIVFGRLADNTDVRFLANTPLDRNLLEDMMREDFIGRDGNVRQGGDINVFTPD